jgi:hypothetical protein
MAVASGTPSIERAERRERAIPRNHYLPITSWSLECLVSAQPLCRKSAFEGDNEPSQRSLGGSRDAEHWMIHALGGA